MIDWLWLRLPVDPVTRIDAGFVLSLKPGGEVEWQTQKWFAARGSHDGTIAVRLDARGLLNVSGSPAKFLQGHNLFGSDDIQGLALEVLERVLNEVPGIVTSEETRAAVADRLVEVLRVDINQSYGTGSRERCERWISEASESCTLARRGRGLLHRSTAYWGKHSRHYGMKAYCKGREIEQKGHRIPKVICTDQMLAYADDALRLELQMNARYLKRLGLDLLCNWKIGDPARLYSDHIGKLNLAGNVAMTPAQISALPRHLRQTYALWQAGEDLKALMSKKTFYRHRGELLALGVDIAARRPASNVVRLLTVIEARPKGVPEFAMGTPLYFEPRRRAV